MAKACRYDVGIETNQDKRRRHSRVFLNRMALLTDQFGGTTHGGGRVLHSIIHRELQVFGSSRSDGDSSWCRASSFACGANRGRDSPGSCRRGLP
jgi:hypothetical protein